MLFSSIPFLYYFLPLVLAAYFVTPARFRNGVLLFSSLFFYAWGEPKYVLLMAVSILCGYGFGLLLERYRGGRAAKYICGISVGISLCFLLYFKYADFFLQNFNAVAGADFPLLHIALPIGISFYTFQIISYTVDVYRGEPAQKNLVHLAAYIAMFPQLIAGPIVRYSDIAAQLEDRTHSTALAAEGIRRFIIGLGKKILLANQLGELCGAFRASEEKSVPFTGCTRWRLRCIFISTFQDTAIWRLGLERFLDSVFWKILITPIFPPASQSFGAAGIFHLERGSETMYISPWEEIVLENTAIC